MSNLQLLKKFTLIIIVLLEIGLGTFFINKFFKQNKTYVTTVKEIEKTETEKFKYFYEPKKNSVEIVDTEWLGEKITYTINEDGFNDTKNYQVEKPDNTFRIITLGDSFTFGQFVDTQDNWTEILERKLNEEFKDKINIEVINLGVYGYDIPYIIERYDRSGKKYSPDLIIWFESGAGFYRYIEKAKPLINSCLEESANNLYDYCWNKAEKDLISKNGFTSYSAELNNYFKDFFELIDASQQVIFLSFEGQFSEEQQQALDTRLTQYPKMDFRQVVTNIYDKKQVLPDLHPNKNGHQTIAESIYLTVKQIIEN